MLKISQVSGNQEYENLKKLTLDAFEAVSSQKAQVSLEDLHNLHKHAASIKAFDLVAISLSCIAFLNFKGREVRYYQTLTALNDAKYLAVSSNSTLASKISLWAFACVELLEENPQSALDIIQDALMISEDNDSGFNAKMLELKMCAEQLSSKISAKDEEPLVALLKVGRTIAFETNIDTLLTIIAQEIKLALKADRCTVFLLDENKKELWSKVALGMDLKEIRFASNLGLAGYVATTGETVNIKDAYNDKRFNKEIDQQTGYKTKTILCMPIRNMSHEIVGVFQVLNKLQDGVFTEKDEDLLLAIGSSAGIALENASLFDKQQKLIKEQEELLSDFIDTLSASIDARDKITSGHSKRVTLYAELICDELNMGENAKNVIRQASLLHDIGKIGIKDSVLQKEGKLTDEEYSHIQEHAHITSDILSKIYSSANFKEIANIASSHHEKFDGSGYFQGLKGEEIPLGGRIIAVTDVFDAITSRRHYRSKMNIEDALEIIIRDANEHFDKNITNTFLSVAAYKILEVILTGLDITILPEDKMVLSRHKLLDLHTISRQAEPTEEGKRFVEIFSKYYEDRI